MVYIKVNRLRRIMEEKGLNQAKLSKLIGVDQAVISRIMNGRSISVGPKTICGILNSLHVKFDDIFFYDKRDCSTGNIKQKNKIVKIFVSNHPDLPTNETSSPQKGKSSSRFKFNHPNGK